LWKYGEVFVKKGTVVLRRRISTIQKGGAITLVSVVAYVFSGCKNGRFVHVVAAAVVIMYE